jgi:hypothetical protein
MTNEQRIRAMLKYLPCRAGAVPISLRQLGLAEREGLAVCGDNYVWTLTPKGQAFMDGRLKAPKARRFA